MLVERVRYTEEWRERWDEAVRTSFNGTFLHQRGFYDHNPANAPQDNSLLFLKKNKIIALLPCVIYTAGERQIMHAHLRATYGGYVLNRGCGVVEAVEIVRQTVEAAEEAGVSEIIIRNPFRIFYEQLSDELDYALWYNRFTLKARELEIYVSLTDGLEVIRKRYENGSKYNIKKAWKAVTVEESTDLAHFWEILTANLAGKHGQKPVHSYEDIQRLISNVGSDKVKLFAAYYNGEMTCGCLVFVMGKVLHAQYIGQDLKYQEFRPVNAVMDYIIQWGAERGFAAFNLGSANEEGGRVINEGLFHFKEGFGGRAVLRETMHLELSK